MGINNEYRDDALVFENDPDYEEDCPADNELILSPEDWHDWHSEHVLNMWMSLRQYLEDNHMNNTLMNKATFHNFAEFVRIFSQ
ncbi:hypothetical protein EBT25_03990 [bacterium]|nr:hypothetical protein [bacterium]